MEIDAMPHDFSQLYALYPALIAQMEDKFTSHQFILELARQHQALYVEALYEYRPNDPFKVVHRVLSQHFNSIPDQVTRDGDATAAESFDIFTQQQGCARWRKVKAEVE
jgi:hypothetical protein